MGCAFDNPQCSIKYCRRKQSEDFSNFFTVNKHHPLDDQLKQNALYITNQPNSSSLKQINDSNTSHTTNLNKQSHSIDSGLATPNNNNKIITHPRIKLYIYNSYSLTLLNTITLTPNSLQMNNNPTIKIVSIPVKFTFGKDARNDCVLNDKSIGLEQFHIVHIKQKYYIIDNPKGTGLFCKVIGKKIIDHDLRICFGGDFMITKVRQNTTGGKDIKITFCLKKDLEYVFNSNNKIIITIGRHKKCDICYQEESISKVQCTILYVKDNWVIMDGSYEINNQKNSTNGTWLLAQKGIEIKKDMILKTGALKITIENDNTTESGDETNHMHNKNNNNSSTKDEDHFD